MNATAVGNLVLGNFIGTDITGKLPLGNEIDGVLITDGASSNSVGGTSTGAGNTIAFNVDYGVDLGTGANPMSNGDGGTGNSILSNSIFSNNPLGINIPGDTSTSSGVRARTPTCSELPRPAGGQPRQREHHRPGRASVGSRDEFPHPVLLEPRGDGIHQ